LTERGNAATTECRQRERLRLLNSWLTAFRLLIVVLVVAGIAFGEYELVWYVIVGGAGTLFAVRILQMLASRYKTIR
jgi:hypothetical protein